jgi:hypothetical protein
MDIGYMAIVYWLDGYMAMRFAYCFLAIGYMVIVMIIRYTFRVWFLGV